MKATFSQVRHPSHPGRGCGSLTCHMTHFEQSDWLRSPNLTNIMIEYHIKPYLCTKFGDSSLKNEFRNAKRGQLIKWSIMRIFNEAEPPWSNLSEILG